MPKIKIINGIEYSRYENNEHWSCAAEETNVPHIICDCGCSSFSLTYGNYKLVAKCIECGISDTVYDG